MSAIAATAPAGVVLAPGAPVTVGLFCVVRGHRTEPTRRRF